MLAARYAGRHPAGPRHCRIGAWRPARWPSRRAWGRRPDPPLGRPGQRARRGRRAAPRLGGFAGRLAPIPRPPGRRGQRSARIFEESRENVGAGVMGRNMFGPVGGGPWGDEQWRGWWGDDPPYHYPMFILTHYPRDPVEMKGG